MPTKPKGPARLHVRLSAPLKALIEQAAAQMGQSITDFATSTLVSSARRILEQQTVTELNNRDRDVFTAMLDDVEAGPNKALKDAAKRYKKSLG